MVCKRMYSPRWVSKVLMFGAGGDRQTDVCGSRPVVLSALLVVDLVGDETVLSGLEVGFV